MSQRRKDADEAAEEAELDSGILQRLEQLVDARHGRLKTKADRYAAFAEEILGRAGTVEAWVSGQRKPSRLSLVRISRALRVSLDWLVLGRGPMYQREADAASDGLFAQLREHLVGHLMATKGASLGEADSLVKSSEAIATTLRKLVDDDLETARKVRAEEEGRGGDPAHALELSQLVVAGRTTLAAPVTYGDWTAAVNAARKSRRSAR